MRHIIILAIAALTGIGASAPAQAQKVFAGIVPENYLKRWSPNEWHVWAMPDGRQCLALSQDPGTEPFKFWGFRQSPGSRLDLIMGSIQSARPRTVQMSFNNGGLFDYPATVEHFLDWDAYVVSLQGNALSVFHDQMFIESYVSGRRVFMGSSNAMKHLEKVMGICLEWQRTH